MKRLVFYRSIDRSFHFKLMGDSYFFPEQSILASGLVCMVPLKVELGCSAPIDPESGMSVSLTEVDALLNLFYDNFSKLQFYDLFDFFSKSMDFFKEHSPVFVELAVTDQKLEFSYRDNWFYINILGANFFKIPKVSTEVFFSEYKYEFSFQTLRALESYCKKSLPVHRQLINKLQYSQNPFVDSHNQAALSVQEPQTLAWVKFFAKD